MATLVAPNGKIGDIPDDQIEKALAAGFKRTVSMVSPDGKVGSIPEDRVEGARKSGFKPLPAAPVPGVVPEGQGSILRGALHGIGLPGSADEAQALLKQEQDHYKEIYDAIHDGNYGAASKALAHKMGQDFTGDQGPFAPMLGLLRTSREQLGSAGDALRIGQGRRALIHAGAAMVPMFAPTVNAMESIDQGGDRQEYTAQAAANTFANLIGLRVPAEQAAQANAARNAVSQESVNATVPKRVTEALLPQDKTALKMNEPITAPDGTPTGRSNLHDALNLAKETEPIVGPLNNTNLKHAVDIAKENHTAQLRRYEYTAEQRGFTGNGKPIADEIRASVPDKIRDNPQYANTVAKIDEMAKFYEQDFKPSKLGSYLKTTNSQIRGLANSLPADQFAALMSNVDKATLDAEATGLRKVYYQTIDNAFSRGGPTPQLDGANAAELNRRVGVLKELGDELDRFQAKKLKTKPDESTVTSHDVISILKNPKLGMPRVAAKMLSPSLPEAQTMLDAALKDFKPTALAKIPEAPGAVTSATTTPNPPAQLTPSRTGKFDRQRLLVEGDPERFPAFNKFPFEEATAPKPLELTPPAGRTPTEVQQPLPFGDYAPRIEPQTSGAKAPFDFRKFLGLEPEQ